MYNRNLASKFAAAKSLHLWQRTVSQVRQILSAKLGALLGAQLPLLSSLVGTGDLQIKERCGRARDYKPAGVRGSRV
jgi:hypothetical protein